GGRCALLGRTPPEDDVRRLAEWVAARGPREVLATDCLSAERPDAAPRADVAAGLLAVGLSRLHASWLLWFRPERVRTVSWGGDPRKPAEAAGQRLHPRRSFELWKEEVRGRASPWTAADVEAAAALRNALLGVVLRKAEETAQLSEELRQSNKELESFSYS